MKKRPLFSLLTGSLLIFSGGCGFLPGGGDVDEAVISPDGQESPPPEIPLRSAKILPPVDMAALGLIPPTLPDQRLREIQAGRSNPFELIQVQATVKNPVSVVDAEGTAKASNGSKTGNTADGGNGNMGANGTGFVGSSPGKNSDGSVSSTDVEPVKLYPDDARAVVVSGIIEIGSRPFAIVRAPGEPVARNVTIGDLLSGGRVRVQSINVQGENSNVVLEQYGDSVTRDVGAPALPPLTPALIPTPPSDS